MESRDTERYLSKFSLKSPGQDLRNGVLEAAKSCWRRADEVRVANFRLIRRCAYVAGMLLLLSIASRHIDRVLTGNLVNGKFQSFGEVETAVHARSNAIGSDFDGARCFVFLQRVRKPGLEAVELRVLEIRSQLASLFYEDNGGQL